MLVEKKMELKKFGFGAKKIIEIHAHEDFSKSSWKYVV